MSRLPARAAAAALLLCALCAGCGPRPAVPAHSAALPPVPAPAAPSASVPAPAAPASPAPARSAPAPLAPVPPAPTGGWHLTVYYTPVESYHGPPLSAVSDCAGRSLGQHPADFLDDVRTEGFGRVTTPIQGDAYLGWDYDRGCWLMAVSPVGADDRPLRPWASTAASTAFPLGLHARVLDCGSDIDPAACARVEAAAWTVDDRCSGDCSDPQHLDLYIGEEDRPDFPDQSPDYFDAHGAVVAVSG